MDKRSREIFSRVVESYLNSGEPVGSRTLSRQLTAPLSAASIRNVMSDLEHAGLLYSPHTSAGRMPTDLGLRMFVDGILEVGNLNSDERHAIEGQIKSQSGSFEDVLTQATQMLSGLSHCAGLVSVPESQDEAESGVKHIEFVNLNPGRALAILVTEDGQVQNRIIQVPLGLPTSSLVEAGNYLSARLTGNNLSEAREKLTQEMDQVRQELDELTAHVVETGIASLSDNEPNEATPTLIVRGRSHLLEHVTAEEELERIRLLFDDLETKQDLLQILDHVDDAEGVRIFIGSENKLFSLSGSSLIVAPYHNNKKKVVGTIGVIGPTRVNYGRIIPMVDYTAQLVGRLLS